jgi:hypothetical protein
MDEPVIETAIVAPGHDGDAVLVVRVRHGNGACDTVTLDATQARKLLDDCGAQTADALRGQPWQRLLHVLEAREEQPCSTF